MTLPITLFACVISNDAEYYKRTVRVLHYCQKLFQFERSLMFSHVPPPCKVNAEVIQIPRLDLDNFGIWLNKGLPPFIKSDFVLSVHEDGFILNHDRWRDRFLAYDYIGAPWGDGVVGNQAFCIQSQKILREALTLPFYEPLKPEQWYGRTSWPSDTYLCRTHRKTLEERGVTFAPRNLAVQFSSEQIRGFPAFGFHGRQVNADDYTMGWRKVIASEEAV